MIREQLPDEDLRAFAWSLFAGVRENRAALDARISAAAENWTMARMAPTDRNALRLGALSCSVNRYAPPRRDRRNDRAGPPLRNRAIAAVRQRHSRQAGPARKTRHGQPRLTARCRVPLNAVNPDNGCHAHGFEWACPLKAVGMAPESQIYRLKKG